MNHSSKAGRGYNSFQGWRLSSVGQSVSHVLLAIRCLTPWCRVRFPDWELTSFCKQRNNSLINVMLINYHHFPTLISSLTIGIIVKKNIENSGTKIDSSLQVTWEIKYSCQRLCVTRLYTSQERVCATTGGDIRESSWRPTGTQFSPSINLFTLSSNETKIFFLI